MKLGVISDTHGHLDNQVHSLFHDVDAIIHAGDIGNDDIMIELQTIAPVTAVRGNMDRVGRNASYREFIAKTFGNVRIFIVHDIGTPQAVKTHLFRSIQSYAPHIIIFGHTHRPYMQYIHNTLYFNPGSASQPRAKSAKQVGLIHAVNSQIAGKFLSLQQQCHFK